MVRGRRYLQPIYGLQRDVKCSVNADGDVRPKDIVVKLSRRYRPLGTLFSRERKHPVATRYPR